MTAVGLSVDLIAHRAAKASITVACAESLTSGAIASALGRGEDASTWFRGGVVAYAPAVKFEVLGVAKGPVVTSSCALQMCRGARRVLAADAAVAVTGVGGPGEEEGRPPGTVYIATSLCGRSEVTWHRFEGEPSRVVEQTVHAALDQLATHLAGRG